jgi:hypothetical protein
MSPRFVGLAGGAFLLLSVCKQGFGQEPGVGDVPDAGLQKALVAHFAALQADRLEEAERWLAPDYFYIAPWGELEFRDETMKRLQQAFDTKTLQDYRIEMRGLHTGPAGPGALWFRMIVREKYLRESGKKARNTFAEDLLTTGVAVRTNGRWIIRYMQQTWSDETLRRMIPILHAAQPVNPEEY